MTLGEPDADQITHFIEQVVPLPDSIPLTIGDAVHNLRSALDILMFGMIGDRAVKPDSVQFPFAKRKDTLVSTMKNRETELAGKKVVAEIEALEPYYGGNKWLSSLHALDIADKHKLIIPMGATARLSSFEMAKMHSAVEGRANINFVLSAGVRLVQKFEGTRSERRANRSNIRSGEYERDTQPTFEIVLGEGQPFETQPVAATLVEMTGKISAAIEKLADAFVS